MWSSPPCSMARPAARSREGWRGTPPARSTASGWSASSAETCCAGPPSARPSRPLALAAGFAAFAPTMSRGAAIAVAYLLPARLLIEVTPGTSKVRAGTPLTVTARVRGLDAGLVPELTVRQRRRRRQRADDAGRRRLVHRHLRSRHDVVSVLRRRRPGAFRRVRDRGHSSGAGHAHRRALHLSAGPRPRSRAWKRIAATSTGPRARRWTSPSPPTSRWHAAPLTMADGSTPAARRPARTVLTASMPIRADGSYRVALTDVDGLENPGDTEYFIRMLNDRPPDVRMMRPGGDKQVTPLEEVTIEARADDDFGVAALELVFQVPGQEGHRGAVRDRSRGRRPAASTLVQLEDLGVEAGRLRHLLRAGPRRRPGRRGDRDAQRHLLPRGEAVRGGVRRRRRARPWAMQGGGRPAARNWPRRRRTSSPRRGSSTRGRGARVTRGSATDIKAVAEAQTELKERAAEAAGEVAAAMADPRRRRVRPEPGRRRAGGDDPMARAVEAMGRAVGELDRLKTADALPFEMTALEQLLKADSDVQQAADRPAAGRRRRHRQPADAGHVDAVRPAAAQAAADQLRDAEQHRDARRKRSRKRIRSRGMRELARRQEALQRASSRTWRAAAIGLIAEDDQASARAADPRAEASCAEQAEELSKQMQQSSQQQSADEQQRQQGSKSQQQSASSRRQSIAAERIAGPVVHAAAA